MDPVGSELAGQPDAPKEWLGFWMTDLYSNLRALALLAVLGVVASFRRHLPDHWSAWGPALYDLAAVGGLLGTAWISRVHSGGYLNVLLPGYAACAGIGGWAFGRLRSRGWLAALAALILVALQVGSLIEHPGKTTVAGSPTGTGHVLINALPTHEDRVGGNELIAALRRLPGPVLVLRHPWYGTLAGKGSFAQSDGITEVLRSHGPRGATDLRRALAGSLNRDHIQAVVLDVLPGPAWLAPQLKADFRLVPGTITPVAVRPPQDINTSPTYLYLRHDR